MHLKKPKVLLAHPGTQYSYQLAKQLDELGFLHEFWTPFTIPKKGLLYKILNLLPNAIAKKFFNRVIENIEPKKIKTMFGLEAKYSFKGRNGLTEKLIHQRNRDFQLAIPEKSLQEADIIIGFDTSSFILAERAKQNGKVFILDQSIAHPKSKAKVFDQLNQLYPQFSQELLPKQADLIKLEAKEHLFADYIITASSFTKKTLVENSVDERKIIINPYGVNASQFKIIDRPQNKKIRFLFLGTLTIRKGINVLLEIWEELAPETAELWIAGPADTKIIAAIPKLDSISYLGKIPHQQLQEVVGKCDVLIFPSFFEGFGLVVLEAMACGLPVITTEATVGPDVIEDGVDGELYHSFDRNTLKEKIISFIKSPEKAKKMGVKAHLKARQFSWEAYGNRWNTLINTISYKN